MKRFLLTPILIPERPLTGRSLLAFQLFSAGIITSSLVLFLIALPARFVWLSRFSAGAERVLLERTLLLNNVIIKLTDIFPYAALATELGVMLIFFLIAVFLFRSRSREWLVLLTAAGLVSFALHITPTLFTWMQVEPGLASIGIIFKAIGLGLSFLFLYLFPSGVYAPRWIRLFALLWVVWAVLWLIYPDSFFSFEDPYTIDWVGFVLLMSWWGVGIFSQLYRYGRISGPVERQQTKFVTFGATIVAIAYCLYVPLRQLMGVLPRPDLAQVIFYMVAPYIYLILVAAIPITIALSVLRYRLWDIDLIIRRTLVYTALTVTLAVLYFASVVLMQLLFVALSGQSAESPSLAALRSPFAVVISTLGIAALFTPLRKRIQNDIDRRFFRQKYDTEQTLEAFGASLREGLELEELNDLLLGVVEETLQPESVNLWIKKIPAGDDNADI